MRTETNDADSKTCATQPARRAPPTNDTRGTDGPPGEERGKQSEGGAAVADDVGSAALSRRAHRRRR